MTLLESLVETLYEAKGGAGDQVPAAAASRLLFDHWACRRAGDAALPATWERGTVARHAAAASVLDRDDVHWGSLTHPGAITWAVVLDVGTRTDADGATALRAAVLGYEVCTRLANALGPSHRQHWHATATAGTVGAAMSAAVLLGLDQADVVGALGHATSIAGGSVRAVIERSGTRTFHRAHAARAGIACAEAARALPATREALETAQGLLAAMSSAPQADRLLRPVERWAIEETGIRVYGATGFAHSAIEAATRLGPRDALSISEVRLAVSGATHALADNAAPVSEDDAWWSVQHAVAAALVTGAAGVAAPALEAHGQVRSLMECFRFDHDRDDLGAAVTVVAADGSEQTASVDVPVGHQEKPVTTEQQLEKWRVLTGSGGESALHAAQRLASQPLRAVVRDAGMEAG